MPARLHDEDGRRRFYTGRGKAYRTINHVLECWERNYMLDMGAVQLVHLDGDAVLRLVDWHT